ncbi:hypothetical protein Pogu_0648 [Pyrobaculum oguniense TE7]|uniref:Uncharacterized protein n=1 Tax=Pyrobaculum oguniense (strain DSM 13380 / JCM 10595 / TE7) TaxID=698757 RepID=H6Q818_PYROT|nr:hypothetical protein Pogu_0648 [Pyrobaculum oguniense TE7]
MPTMRLLIVAFVLATAFVLGQTVLVVNGTSPYQAYVEGATLKIDGGTVALPRAINSWIYNGSYTVFGVYYSNPECVLGQYPNQPKFYVTCTKGADFTVVAVKDPKARVICRAGREAIKPAASTAQVEIYQARGLNIECESGYTATASAPTQLVGLLAGLTASTATVLLALGLWLVRLKK